MDTPPRIRMATPQDDARIGELLVESFVSTYARKMPEVVVTDARKRDLRDIESKRQRGAAVLVAELEGRIVGTVTLFPPGDPTSRAWTPATCDLRYMAVDPSHQGKGIARHLLDQAKRTARDWSAAGICLHVRRGAHGVAGVYLANGWIRRPEGDQDHLPEIFLDAYLLEIGRE